MEGKKKRTAKEPVCRENETIVLVFCVFFLLSFLLHLYNYHSIVSLAITRQTEMFEERRRHQISSIRHDQIGIADGYH